LTDNRQSINERST